jgi:S1-C subfamily serine protease
MSAFPLLTASVLLPTLLVVGPADEKAGPGFIGVQIKYGPNKNGFEVVQLVDGGPADKAGMKANDVITLIDGEAVGTLSDFVTTIAGHKPGDKITLKVFRDGKAKEIAVTVGEAPKAKAPDMDK